ncbi:unnamed protein product [Enterobius vermicularis]|uniref:Protein AATF n=1 Tax=Enterobius vermicularis TaxID=51028 RepID=A0A0N4V574_ENTVE|nr:unnamed protein product [Enterobius vermicularis]
MKKKSKLRKGGDVVQMEGVEDEDRTADPVPEEESDEEEPMEGTDEDEKQELMEEDLQRADKLDFDFEALPPHENDKEGIINLLTQVYRLWDAFICCRFLQSAEDNVDEGSEDVVYGILSLLPLGCTEEYEKGIWSFLLNKAKKYAVGKKVFSKLESLSSCKNTRTVMLINERMLHFPEAIAKPSFKALLSDLAKDEDANDFTHVISVMKIRVADVNIQEKVQKKKDITKKKVGKAEKKRIWTAALLKSKTMFDNPEEELLFQETASEEEEEDLQYFQYPVESDVEKGSKFSAFTLYGTNFRPYRRVCVMSRGVFDRFAKAVSSRPVI